MTPERKLILARFLKFGLVGFSGVFVNLAVFEVVFWALANAFPEDQKVLVSNFVGIVVSIFTNFLLNDKWTWGDRQKIAGTTAWLRRVARYYVAASAAAGIQLAATYLSFRFFFQSFRPPLRRTILGPLSPFAPELGARWY